MTDRHNRQVGASTCILRGWKNHTEEGFDLYRQAGIKYAELSVSVWNNSFEGLDFYDNPQKIKEIAKRCDVEFAAFHAPFSQEISFSHPDENQRKVAVDTIKRAITSAAKIGIKIMVLHPSGAHYENYPDREVLINQSMECVGEVYRYCESLGVTLAVENLTGRGVCGIPEEMLLFLNAFPNMQVCFDTNHCAHIAPEDYLEALLSAGMKGRVATLHISDYDLSEEKHRLPGDGKINWEKVLSKLEELEYNGVFMYEVSKANDRETHYTPQMVADNFREIISVGASIARPM